MVNKPLIRPYFWGEVALGGVARIPMMVSKSGAVPLPNGPFYGLVSSDRIIPIYKP